ncbi:MAG: polyphosphate kinase 1 [Bacteroidota bacterium]|nr:polyphosphate kinase 1 [Bacteroidota bacterium]MDX5447427.1 polyphosphate kinase 1 [Bacteroidota bacterium]MDX5505839.1 polyphosphate kinase 1 [Bacteroidota bacterium]
MNNKQLRKRFFNRDKSWLQFNARVLQEAEDPSVPVIERLRFLGIFSNNLDEFFRVRYASIKRMNILGEKAREELGGISPNKLLNQITDIVIRQQKRSGEIYDELMEELEKHDIKVVDETHLTTNQKEYVRKYFIEKVSPSIFTLIVSDKKEIPELRDKSIYLSIKLSRKDAPDNPMYALIEVPTDYVGRFISLPKYGKHYIMYLDDLIRVNLKYIFFIFNYDTIEAHTIKITRDAELDIDNDVSKSFLEKISRSVRDRRIGDPVRFVYDKEIPVDILQFLMSRMQLDSYDSLIAGGRYHNKKDFMDFPNVGGHELEHPKYDNVPHPDLDLDRSILNVVKHKDVLLFLPYHTFSYIIRFLREAALDPKVEHIRISLYRLAPRSRVISALINAAKNGKRVTVMIELQARFDEENNIGWTKQLRSEGVEIINTIPGLKVHSKVCLVSRREGKDLKDYAILGTGNYHEGTAKFYTDYHLMTSDTRITSEIAKVFEFFRANYQIFDYQHLIVSPRDTRRKFMELIDNEIDNSKKGLPAAMFLKMNSISDFEMIEKLYEASSYGVKIRLIIRGICCLVPGQKDLSENIEAISIVDRYLEHSRVFIFENGGDPLTFIGSADFMVRNLDHRVEITTPVYDKRLARQLRDHMEIIWKDNVKSRWHNKEQDNAYRVIPGPRIRSQIEMYNYLRKLLSKGRL